MTAPLLQADCPDLELVARGKVRDLFRLADGSLLFVASDRISAFDVVMASPIPGKGKILTQLSVFWFQLLRDAGANHLLTADIDQMPPAVQAYRKQLQGRVMQVKSLQILPVEVIIRGYLAGSGWKEYQQHGTICDISLPSGLQESSQLPQALFTPSTKAALGAHDDNISPARAAELLGPQAERLASRAIDLYRRASTYAAARGIIIADTKFEFGLDSAGELVLADEVLTPDSSRFWPAASYAPGRSQDSYDKQYVRDYLEEIGFDKKTPVELPPAVVQRTLDKYLEAFVALTGRQPDL